ncbi:HAD family hydrolase [Candidatus Haliotispira prima]|uniref:HAD family hydrolase n=1 Tax=Candidatus Haliotispira prima TaxID=3034016 RepID=A0ABY8MFT7_9SPIO|nr:HAD family hydrolase [Candidatus Haliotispira prima]
MNKKVFACDMDGTLLDSSGRISPANKQALELLRQIGYAVLLVSGRHPMLMLKSYRELGLSGPVIGCNGAFIYLPQDSAQGQQREPPKKPANPAEQNHFEALPTGLVSQLVELARPYPLDVVLDCDCGLIKLRDQFSAFENYPASPPFEIRQQSDYRLPEERDRDGNETGKKIRVCKVVFAAEGAGYQAKKHTENREEKEIQSRKHRALLEQLQQRVLEFGGLYPVFPEYLFLDIVDRNINKLVGVQRVAQQTKHLIAIGDGENDIPLLQAANFSIAMGNAPDKVKQLAHHVTTHHDDDGLARAVEYLENNGLLLF